MKSFDEIYIINLHGGGLREKIPDHIEKDQNVFEISQGVCILFCIKLKPNKEDGVIKVYYKDLYGTSDDKLDYLKRNTIQSIKEIEENDEDDKPFEKIYETIPKLDHNYFIPLSSVELVSKKLYDFGIPIIFLFKERSSGVNTGKKEYFIDINFDSLYQRVRTAPMSSFQHLSAEDKKTYVKDIMFHPFDKRYIFYFPSALAGNRQNFYKKLKMDTKILALVREKDRTLEEWKHYFITKGFIDIHFCDSSASTIQLYPLELKSKNGISNFNIHEIFRKFLSVKYRIDDINFEDIFNYIIGILHSKWYRTTFEQFIKKNFQKIIFPKSYEIFSEISRIGGEVSRAHLMELEGKEGIFQYSATSPTFEIGIIGDEAYDRAARLLRINDNVSVTIENNEWDYYIGTFYCIKQWFIDRKGYTLTMDDREYIEKLVRSISRLIELEENLNNFLDANPLYPIDGNQFIEKLVKKKAIYIFREKVKILRNKRGKVSLGIKADVIIEEIKKYVKPIEIENISKNVIEILDEKTIKRKDKYFPTS